MYKWLKDTSGTGFLRFGQAPNKRVQDGNKLYWLCEDCEQLFSRWETAFAREVFYPLSSEVTDRAAYGHWLLKFCVSVSWRVLNYFLEEADLDHFPGDLRKSSARAHQVWQEFLRGEREHPGRHEQHLLPLASIGRFSHGELPPNINQYFLRTVEMDAVHTKSSAFVFAKLGRFAIMGFIEMPRPREWQGTKVHVRQGFVGGTDFVLPRTFGEYLFNRPRTMAQRWRQVSAKQWQKIGESYNADPARGAASESFRALDDDVRLFGEGAFMDDGE